MPTDDFSRRDMLRLSALLTASGALPFLRTYEARAQEADAPLRIGYLPITDATPLLVAHAKGLFEAEGVKVEKPVLFRSWAQIAEAFIAGQVNVVHLLSPITVWARFGSKVPAKVVAWNHTSGSGLSVANDVNSVKELGGKTVAIPFWYSIHNVVLQAMLRENGLVPVQKRTGSAPSANEVELVVMSPSDMVPALANKRIAGYIVAEPFNAAAETLGVGKVLRFTSDVWKAHACCVVFMHEKDLTTRPEWTQKVVNAMVKAQLWTRDNRAETAAMLSKDGENKYTPHTKEVLAKVLAPSDADIAAYVKSGAIQHPDWKERRIDFQPYPFPSYTEELVRRLKDTLVDGDRSFLAQLDPAAAARELVDDTFVKKAVTAAGGLAAFGLPNDFSRQEVVVA
ncbi:ABC transporter substrate-binding protein [Bradyrhizobium sp. LHD-71]|uniref:ABC transporter substrate-binding protein n=1 Tax=Bradyrhizobium sp. LHD-71 TaxID=3072141 RepID=UPI00280C9919|nr:ABC transporter substrate-binding protein [Bradyrhizobium sp. LHD-71]MDQ8731021.1 ABC transporter substrate-binding protein [Bradyrhizobium sp. LHD-71]